ncbi:MAG: DUF2855 family protein [Sphingorhabdus sp.]
MSSAAWAIDIDRDDVTRAEIVAADTEVGPGEILMRIDNFAMTANNVTYAVFGKPAGLFGNEQGYWDFFADRDVAGRLPVWGFATVLVSDIEGVAPGDRFYGYYPMASHAVLMPGQIGANGFTDVTPRRTTLPPIYNQYQRVEAIPDYRAEHHDYWPIFRPLFLTGWLIADQFEDEGDYGAEQLLVASASSKTAIGFAHAMKQRARRPQMVGLTSKANARGLAALDLYDSVLAYDDIGLLDGAMPTALVDMAGNAGVTRAVHSAFGDNLVKSIIVGKSHWNADAEPGDLPGPAREGFFAPGRSQKRIADWGARGFGERIGTAWLDFMEIAPSIAEIDRRRGSDGALDAYREMLDGRADPKVGIIIAP